MENQEQIKSIVLDYIRKEYIDDEDEEIHFDTPLISGGYVDSFSMITLLVFLENNFRIKIPSSKATPEAFNTVNNIALLVSQYIKN